ncbi:hypothetical protein [Halorussus salinisoli]|uniref:hypothetical protein n=1 Tax=Halorussus salinisoli TaxID=2558242 RepID=UPI0010C1DCBF|nr:hypothetical protein [Halorussus salinisoli]
MNSDADRWLSVGILAFGVVLWLALTVYPLQYDRVESLILVGLLVLAGFFELVLDDAIVGE